MENGYNVKLTDYALNQMKETVSYIADTLAESLTAKRWLDTMEQEIQSLSDMPRRIGLMPEEPWHSAGVRRMGVKNFFVYFWIDEAARTVWVTAVVYARRHQEEQIEEMKKGE